MKIIANSNIPNSAINKLNKYGEVLPLETTGITYSAISGHPDVFFCLTDNQLIVAPNTPKYFKEKLHSNNVLCVEGQVDVGNSYPETATYNAVITPKFLIHNLKITDNSIREACIDKTAIHVNQAYTRCNLLPLKNNNFITSDKGIYSALTAYNLNVLYVNPKSILLPGFKNGFFGGACGTYKDQFFVIGSLASFMESEKVRILLHDLGYQIVELYDGQLYDGGSLVFIDRLFHDLPESEARSPGRVNYQ